jgi:hypothetical protein
MKKNAPLLQLSLDLQLKYPKTFTGLAKDAPIPNHQQLQKQKP